MRRLLRNLLAFRVDFFICGVQKGGTTALDRMLRDHPQICMCRRKEPHFFDDETLSWTARRPPWLALQRHHTRFRNRFATAFGEATPITSFWPEAVERVAAYNPAARMIVIFRNPIERAHSQWRMETVRKRETLDFSTAIREGRTRVTDAPDAALRLHSYVERGFYAWQVRRLEAAFPRDQILYLKTDDLWRDQAGTLAAVHRFIGVEPKQSAQATEDGDAYTAPVRSRHLGGMDASDRAFLRELFADDVAETARLTGLDLADWLAPDYAEPMEAS